MKNQQKSFYEQNVKKAQGFTKEFLASSSFKNLTPKQKIATESILTTILTSEYLLCTKSNRTLAAETGVSVRTINVTRRKLAELGIARILIRKNGNYANPRHHLILNNCWFPAFDEMKLTGYKIKTKVRIHLLTELDCLDLNKLVDLKHLWNKNWLMQQVAILKSTDQHYVQDLADADIYAVPVKKRKGKKRHWIENIGVIRVDTQVKLESRLLSFPLPSLASSLTSYGFPIVPVGVWCGQKYLIGKARLDNLSKSSNQNLLKRFIKCFSMRETPTFAEWMEEYASDRQFRMFNRENHTHFEEMLVSKWNKTFNHAKNLNGVGVILPKNIICLDVDDESLYPVVKALVPEGYWTKTKRGYHCFVRDSENKLEGVKIKGLDILRQGQMVVFEAFDDQSNSIYPYISGDLANLPEVPDNFDLWFLHVSYTPKVEVSPKFRTSKSKGFQLPETVEIGTRNTSLFALGRSLRARGFTQDYITEALETANENPKLVTNELPSKEMRNLVSSVLRQKDRADFVRIFPLYSRSI